MNTNETNAIINATITHDIQFTNDAFRWQAWADDSILHDGDIVAAGNAAVGAFYGTLRCLYGTWGVVTPNADFIAVTPADVFAVAVGWQVVR